MRILLVIILLTGLFSIQKTVAFESSNSEVMGKKYVTYYQDFLKNKDYQELKQLDEMRTQISKIKNSTESIYANLGLLNVAIDSENMNYSEFAIQNLKSKKSKMSLLELDIFKIYHAKYLYLKNDYAGAILLLKPLANKGKSILSPLVSPLYLDALLDLGLRAEALDYYKKNSEIVEQNLDWETLNSIYVKLASAAVYFNQFNLALNFLKKPLLFYPVEKAGRESMVILAKIECAGGSIGSLYFREENMMYLSREIFRRIGNQTDSKNYVLALIGINPQDPLPKVKVDKLSIQEKLKILSIADLLINSREYQLADIVLEYLSEAEMYIEPFSKDKILDMRGRVFNALQKPLKAAQSYFRIFNEMPTSKLADTAKLKYAMSLHYARNNSESAQFSIANQIYTSREEQSWFTFWQYYLSSQFLEAENKAKEYVSLSPKNADSNRFQYWLNVLRKNKIDKDLYIKNLTEISNKNFEYPYPIFSRMKLNEFLSIPYKVNIVNNQNFKDFYVTQSNPFINKKLQNPQLEIIRKLVNYKLNEIAKQHIKAVNIKRLKKKEIVALANLAYMAKDYKLASELMRNNFSYTLQDYNIIENWSEKTNFWKLNFPLAYWSDIQNASRLADIDPFWLLSIMRAESSYDAKAESPVGAIGLMQIMPYTGLNISKHIGKENFNIGLLKDPGQSIAFSAWYLRMLLKIYNGNYLLATAAYNSGPEAVNRWINQNSSLTIDEFYENIPFQETKRYVAKVLGFLDIYYKVQLGVTNGYSLDSGENLPDIFIRMKIF